MNLKHLINFIQKMLWLIDFEVNVRAILRADVYKKIGESAKKTEKLSILKV